MLICRGSADHDFSDREDDGPGTIPCEKREEHKGSNGEEQGTLTEREFLTTNQSHAPCKLLDGKRHEVVVRAWFISRGLSKLAD